MGTASLPRYHAGISERADVALYPHHHNTACDHDDYRANHGDGDGGIAKRPAARRTGHGRDPAGAYLLGGATVDRNHVAARLYTLPRFFIDADLVTNAQYQTFLQASGRPAPAAWGAPTLPAGREHYPVEGLSADDARSYCRFLHKRLPGEAEWEAAGRGPGANPPSYPWGEDASANGQAYQLAPTDTYPAGSQAFNRGRAGVFDLVGTVWQWVEPPYAPLAAGVQLLRGGRHGYLQDLTFRQPATPDDESFIRFAGVRCAADQVAPAR